MNREKLRNIASVAGGWAIFFFIVALIAGGVLFIMHEVHLSKVATFCDKHGVVQNESLVLYNGFVYNVILVKMKDGTYFADSFGVTSTATIKIGDPVHLVINEQGETLATEVQK